MDGLREIVKSIKSKIRCENCGKFVLEKNIVLCGECGWVYCKKCATKEHRHYFE